MFHSYVSLVEGMVAHVAWAAKEYQGPEPDNQKNTAHMGLYKNTPKQSKTIVPNKSFPQRITMEGQ